MYDILIIGAGVSGCAVARELGRYNLRTAVIEKCEDVCCGTTKANSAIAHAGFDAKAGTLKAKLNVRGSEMMEQLSKDLDFPYRRIGSLVLCLSEEDRGKLEDLYENGIKNGVRELKILTGDEVRKLEPNISDECVGALYAPTSAIICPFELNIALAENAYENHVEFFFDTEVMDIRKNGEYFEVSANDTVFRSKIVINAAGVYADKIHNMVSGEKINITPRRGDYLLLDKTSGDTVSHTIFSLPGAKGKGVLTSPTVHGNLIIGPTAFDVEDREGTNTTLEGIEDIKQKAGKNIKDLPLKTVITSFAGLRAHEDGGEFIIGEANDCKGFIDVAGIESPGLSSAPAIGEMVAGIVRDILNPEENKDFKAMRKGIVKPGMLSFEERQELIKARPEYGNIICRCEMVSEGEIIDAIRRPLGAKSLDGVKRRTRAGMGRCQAGFCSPRTMEIISRELEKDMLDITKSGGDSKLLVGKSK
ncbi:MAG: NAD(P)/FAD-dependent oxidoreductase [Lachnospiraceae bacterium]|nr:NAD(P)/FAD-dependent oxidoreductase [Lachnospiraceae bacterium]